MHGFCLATEELRWQFVEGVVVVARGFGDEHIGSEQLHLGSHVVNRQCPFAIGQLCVLLRDLHVVHEVDIRLLRKRERAALHVQR